MHYKVLRVKPDGSLASLVIGKPNLPPMSELSTHKEIIYPIYGVPVSAPAGTDGIYLFTSLLDAIKRGKNESSNYTAFPVRIYEAEPFGKKGHVDWIAGNNSETYPVIRLGKLVASYPESKTYTVSLTLTVPAENETEAWERFKQRYQFGDYGSEEIDIEEE